MKESPIINKNYLKPYTLKPTEIPPEFTLIVDTREQRPLFTRIPKGLTVMSKTLINGDYSVLGFEDSICFERKSADLWPYVIDHEKTKAKMLRFKSMEFVGLIIELKEHEIYQFQQHTRVHPETVRGALTSFQVRYGVHVYMGTRENCSRWLLDCAVKFWKVKREVT